jgi:hypothetical protein
MPELLLPNIDKSDFTKLYRAAEKGDQDARVAIFHMWDAMTTKNYCASSATVYAQIQKLTLPFRADLRYGSS